MSVPKRIFDFVVSTIGIIILSPLLLIVSFLIYLDDGKPIFFRQTRVGYKGKEFKIWKFRTMVNNAEQTGGQITLDQDPRITKLGHVLRKTKIDELPQLFNVWLGEMSFVGPRPEVPKYVAFYSEDQRRVLELVPGITDPASIKYRNENSLIKDQEDTDDIYVSVIMPDKIKINLEYAEKANLLTDIGIIFKTLFSLFDRDSKQNQRGGKYEPHR